jgi:hypothetical protein
MSSAIHEALADLRRDVDTLEFAPPAAIRARGTALRRRHTAAATAAVAVGMAVTTALAVPVLRGAGSGAGPGSSGAPPSGSTAGPTPCASPSYVERRTGPPPSTSRRVNVLLHPTATEAQIAAVAALLGQLHQVSTFRFVDRASVWQEFRALFCHAPELIDATTPDLLPERFVVTLIRAADFGDVQRAAEAMPGVSEAVRGFE